MRYSVDYGCCDESSSSILSQQQHLAAVNCCLGLSGQQQSGQEGECGVPGPSALATTAVKLEMGRIEVDSSLANYYFIHQDDKFIDFNEKLSV